MFVAASVFAKDQTVASDAGITATPTFIVNGHLLRGVLDSLEFLDLRNEIGR